MDQNEIRKAAAFQKFSEQRNKNGILQVNRVFSYEDLYRLVHSPVCASACGKLACGNRAWSVLPQACLQKSLD